MESGDLHSLGPLRDNERALLKQFAFDAPTFCRLRDELAAGRFGPERNRVADSIAPPSATDIVPWPAAGAANSAALHRAGEAALQHGQVAMAILNGGMATRFGGRVKGIVEVVGDLSFLGIKLRQLAAAPGPVPVFLMNSFATDRDTRAHLEANNYFGVPRERVHIVTQTISLRLTPDGALFRDAAGQVSFYAPGHGDLLAALATSPAFGPFAAQAGAMVAVSNVDNLGATLEPRVLGAHLEGNKAITVEVATREGGDTGGAPVRRGGKLEVLEGFRFPADFPMASLPVFNTNSFIFNTQAVRGDYPLTWLRADKKVDGQAVVQFERLVGEITAFVPATYLVVPRQGPEGRFMPVKTPDDIAAVRPLIKARFALED